MTGQAEMFLRQLVDAPHVRQCPQTVWWTSPTVVELLELGFAEVITGPDRSVLRATYRGRVASLERP